MAGEKSMPSLRATRWMPGTAEQVYMLGIIAILSSPRDFFLVSALTIDLPAKCAAPSGSMDGWKSSTFPYSFLGTRPCIGNEAADIRTVFVFCMLWMPWSTHIHNWRGNVLLCLPPAKHFHTAALGLVCCLTLLHAFIIAILQEMCVFWETACSGSLAPHIQGQH